MSAFHPDFSEVRSQYIQIIDDVLSKSDLTTISQKRIRKSIQDAVDFDITSQKAAINELIMQRFNVFEARVNKKEEPDVKEEPEVAATEAPPTPPATNGHAYGSPSPSKSPVKRQSESEDLSEVADEAPPKKKVKKEAVDSDAVLAARLQAEENARSRPTRGGGPRKAAPNKRRTPKKKTAAKVRGSDDSDLSGSDAAEKPVRNTGFHKPMNLSPALSALLDGETTLSRPQTVKRLWAHIKENHLQDPADKRNIICDELMRAVFKQDKIHMFTMTKVLNQNLYTPDE